MATAHVTPKEDLVWDIDFNYDGSTLTVSPQALVVGATDEVNFSNSPNSTATITITFAANPPGVANPPGPVQFPNISLTPGQTIGMVPLHPNGSVNYTVSVNGATVEETYAIQVGNGPLYVQITDSNSTPDPAVIPLGGTLEMYSTDGNTYNLTWPATGNPFPKPAPGLTTVNHSVASNIVYTESKNKVATYEYNFPVHKTTLGVGTGKIVVTS